MPQQRPGHGSDKFSAGEAGKTQFVILQNIYVSSAVASRHDRWGRLAQPSRVAGGTAGAWRHLADEFHISRASRGPLPSRTMRTWPFPSTRVGPRACGAGNILSGTSPKAKTAAIPTAAAWIRSGVVAGGRASGCAGRGCAWCRGGCDGAPPEHHAEKSRRRRVGRRLGIAVMVNAVAEAVAEFIMTVGEIQKAGQGQACA